MVLKNQDYLSGVLTIVLVTTLALLITGCAGKTDPVMPEITDQPSGQNLQDTPGLTNSPSTTGVDPHTLKKFVDNEVLVVLQDSIAQGSFENVLNVNSLTLIKEIVCNWGTVYELEITDGTPVETMVARLDALPSTKYVDPNYIYYFDEAPYVPNDPMWEDPDDVGDDPRDSVYEQWGPAKIGTPIVWHEDQGSSDVVIAILDTGVRRDHEDLADDIWINEDEIPGNDIDDDLNGYIDDTWGWDCESNDNDPWDEGWWGNYHGTACSSVAAAIMDNGAGVCGIAPNSKIMALRIGFEEIWESVAVEAVEYAVNNGADILSMSFGGLEDGEIFHAALDAAWDNGNGLNLLSSAGNYEMDEPFYPSGYDSVMSIAATAPFTDSGDPMDEKKITSGENGYYWGSNYGDTITISGFGSNYITASGTCPDCYYDGGYEEFFGGTSCACPMSAGVMALLHSYFPGESAQWYWNRLQYSADDLNTPGYDIYTGWGRCNALRAIFGSDRLADIEDPRGFVPFDLASSPLYDSIHDFPLNPFNDKNDLYKITVSEKAYVEIYLDIYTWGENLDLELYSDPGLTELINTTSGPNYYDSSFETIGFNNTNPGTEYYLKVFSPEEGNSTTYSVSMDTFENYLTISGSDITPAFIYQTQAPIPFLSLELEAGYEATLDEISIRSHGNVPSSSLHKALVAIDADNDSEWDANDTIIGEGDFNNLNISRIDVIDTYFDSEDNLSLLVGVVAGGAPDGSELWISLENYKDVETNEGLEAYYTDFPIVSGKVILGLDTDPPYWETTTGAQNAIPGYGFATIEFNRAIDDHTPPVKYNLLYTDTLPFGSGEVHVIQDVATSSGDTTDLKGTVMVEGDITWHFKIQAEDQAGNGEFNDEIVSCAPEPGADPYNPQLLDRVMGVGGTEIAMDGDIIVSTSIHYTTHLGFFHRNTPLDVEYVSDWIDRDSSPNDVEISGDYVYVSTMYSLLVLNISDYENPVLINQFELNCNPMTLHGDYLYIADSRGPGLHTVNISDPYNIPPPYSIMTPHYCSGELLVSGDYLYLCAYDEGVYVFLISDPAHPIYMGSFGDNARARRIATDGETLYVNETCGELFAFDLAANPLYPPFLGSHTDPMSCFCNGVLAMNDSYVYTTAVNHGLFVYDVSDKSNIQLISDFDQSGLNEMVNDGPIIYTNRGGQLVIFM